MIIKKDLNIFAYFVVSRIKVYLSLLAKLKTNGRNLKWKFHSKMIKFLNSIKIYDISLKKRFNLLKKKNFYIVPKISNSIV